MNWELEELKTKVRGFEYSKADRYEMDSLKSENHRLIEKLTSLSNDISYLRDRIQILENRLNE